MITKYNYNKSLVQRIKDDVGLDLSNLENGKLLEITQEIINKANQTPILKHHPKILDYCTFLPQLAKYGPLPADCKWHIAQVYSHLSPEDKSYVNEQLVKIREAKKSV